MSHPPHLRAVGAGALAAAAIAALALQPTPSIADPSGKPVSELLRELQILYSKTETATDAYRQTAAKLDRQREKAEDAEQALTSVRSVLAKSRREAGQLARQQYRRGDIGLPPLVQLLLTRDPRNVLEGVHVVTRVAGHQARTVQRLVASERRQRELTTQARSALAKQKRLAKRQRQQRDEVRERLDDVEGMLASLSQDELSRLRNLETPQNTVAHTVAQHTPMSAVTVAASKKRRMPSSAGAQAVKFALRQIGKPYRFGAAGPNAFDCSGLTSKAWRKAGRNIPRTSQGQWNQLRRVKMKKLRPGDLVVYYRNAGHVALYVGRGKVVHAPRPGRDVKLAPVRSMRPVLGAVRPDSGARPSSGYSLPKLLRSI
ncbi:NlpC/P60 family protein [Streptomyces ovatisporus]|uniref:NlpC/P60 family protein n=1 Tax=Streptomyces ovatisporus TaxID=1128682 RepID=A0ABV9A3D7_9ACTN